MLLVRGNLYVISMASNRTTTPLSTNITTTATTTATTTTTTAASSITQGHIRCIHNSHTYSKHAILIPSSLNTLLHSDKHLKYHFHSIGGDFIRLSSYKRFKQLFHLGGGSLIKTIVFDLSTFLKQELNDEKSSIHLELKNFMTLNNSILQKREARWCLCDHQFGMKNWLYIIFGYMLQHYTEEEVNECLDDIIKMYLSARKNRISPDDIRIIRDERDIITLNTFQNFVNKVKIREDLLYGSNHQARFVSFSEANNKRIYLPPLPKLHDRELLVKALMHKEYYRLLLDPRHSFAKTMQSKGYDLSFSEYGIIRKEISFLDGLGDFFLAQETSKLIYDLCNETSTLSSSSHKVDLNVNSTTYNLIKMILATNTLMSKLTKCYNLYRGLDDEIINTRIANDYISYTLTGVLTKGKDIDEMRIYEEEFLGDFFESYMAALLIEQADVAKRFIREIYKRLLSVITETLPPQVTYQHWTTNILGRNIYCKKEIA